MAREPSKYGCEALPFPKKIFIPKKTNSKNEAHYFQPGQAITRNKCECKKILDDLNFWEILSFLDFACLELGLGQTAETGQPKK